jgi:hypothetical protein
MSDIVSDLLSTNVVFFVFFMIGVVHTFGLVHGVMAFIAYAVVMHVLFDDKEGFAGLSSADVIKNNVTNDLLFLGHNKHKNVCLRKDNNHIEYGVNDGHKFYGKDGRTICTKKCGKFTNNKKKCLNDLYKEHQSNYTA